MELDGLYAKQARLSQFTTRNERDTWLQNQIKELSTIFKELEQQVNDKIKGNDSP
jgi:structural maintenance of chromosome 3 (chondroitin sulfate proteoglycan 6)